MGKLTDMILFNPKKVIAGTLLAALVGTTAVKDNVHFSAVEIHNMNKNQYVWGIGQNVTLNYLSFEEAKEMSLGVK